MTQISANGNKAGILMKNCTPDINQNFNVNSSIYHILEVVHLMRNKHKTSKIVVKPYFMLSTC